MMEEEVVTEMYEFIPHDSAHTYTKQIFFALIKTLHFTLHMWIEWSMSVLSSFVHGCQIISYAVS
jgi:hypothetical protein